MSTTLSTTMIAQTALFALAVLAQSSLTDASALGVGRPAAIQAFVPSVIARQAAPNTGSAPIIPAAFPSVDQTKMISGDLLTAEIVTKAMAIVNAAVPANLLAIPPSTYVSGSTVTYKADAASTCYWPSNQCIRRTAITGVPADVYTCPGSGQWGITYDDGPTNNNGKDDTIAILAALAKQNAKATFFAVGSNVIQFPQILKQADNAGHQIAGHTWTHHPLTSLTNEQVVAELKYTEAVIYQAIGKVPAYFRPPYGDIDDRVRAIAGALGYTAVIWDKDSTDADVAESAANADTVFNIINQWITAPNATGFVSLEHDISTFTSNIALRALDAIAAAKAAGTFKYTLQPAATCNGHAFYHFSNTTTTTTTTAAPTAVATATRAGSSTARASATSSASAGSSGSASSGAGQAGPSFGVLSAVFAAVIVAAFGF
ncbi:hypothetical protein BJ742DRAFT_384288 [Cladochytrium replicatum]|nr:hypothetical protein BJ742DRAFT_384288 [Cladochytrium replicatum]